MLLFSVDCRSVCADGIIIYFQKGPLNDRYVSRNPCLFPWSKFVSYTAPTCPVSMPACFDRSGHVHKHNSYKLHVLSPNPTDPTIWYRRIPTIMEVGRNKYRTRMGIDFSDGRSDTTRAQCPVQGLTEISCRRHPNVSIRSS